jgi:hypothetical protein
MWNRRNEPPECLFNSPVAGRKMATRSEQYLEKATACERAAGRANDPMIKQSYQEAARQWRKMAETAAAHEAKYNPGPE